jgi:hypothetical protein
VEVCRLRGYLQQARVEFSTAGTSRGETRELPGTAPVPHQFSPSPRQVSQAAVVKFIPSDRREKAGTPQKSYRCTPFIRRTGSRNRLRGGVRLPPAGGPRGHLM